jgi:galacturonokinase
MVEPLTGKRQQAEMLRSELAARHGVPRNAVRVVRAPYRICPLGAHIDHQRGPVTAMAIDRSVLLAYAPSSSRDCLLSSLDFPGEVRFSLDGVPGRKAGDWGNFPRGAVLSLQDRYALNRGLFGLTTGKLHGGGVSSSAAVTIAFLLAFEDVNNLSVSASENIELDRWVENDYLGLRNGILDQAAILLSRRGHLTQIDCRTSQHKLIAPAPAMLPFKILLAFSGLSQPLVGTDYNRRVDECGQAARILLSAGGRNGVEPVLGNVGAELHASHHHLLPAALARRAAHYFSEIERVQQGIAAWKEGDLARFGALMTASGESSISNYECGTAPLIDLFRILMETEGVYGARFSGGGFRGYCVALVEPDAIPQAVERVRTLYAERQPALADRASLVVCDPDDGAAILDPTSSEPRPPITDERSLQLLS